MDLREFVGNVLVQIIQGVKDAQGDGSLHGALVNPRVIDMRGRVDPQSGLTAGNGEAIRDVQFDVVVAVAGNSETEAGEDGELSARSLTVIAQNDPLVSSNAVSRVKFRVPITFPATD